MLEAEARFAKAGLDFAKHAVAVTGVGSELDQIRGKNGWLARFPMYDWIGGRTSVMSAVGLVPAALQGFDIDDFLAGAAAMDAHTRVADARKNAAMLLALMWFYAGNGRGEKDMVILPYKDRLALFSKYLQQLVMESLGKEKDLAREYRASGHRGLRQQRFDRSARLRAATARRRTEFLRDVHRGANGSTGDDDRSRTGHHERRLSARFSPRDARGACTRMDANRSRSRIPEVERQVGGRLIALYERAVGLLRLARATSTPIINPGSKRERKPRREFSSCRAGCWHNFPTRPGKPPRKSRAR